MTMINKNDIENLELNRLEDALINNRIRWYGHILIMNEDRIPKKFENEGKTDRGHQDGNHRLGNIPFRRKKLKRNIEMTELERFSYYMTHIKVEMAKEAEILLFLITYCILKWNHLVVG
jgi:hypothetical protein